MKLKKFPVLDMCDFKSVIVDATHWQDGTYSAMFHFIKEFSTDEKSQAKGFVLTTHIEGESLRELYHKISDLFDIGFFDGSELSAHGDLRDHTGEVIDQICWHHFGDDIDEDITDEIIHSASKKLH